MECNGLTKLQNEKYFNRVTSAIMLVFLAMLYAYRLLLITRLPYNPDEFFILGCSWLMANGMQPYLDFIVPHPALLYSLLKPLAVLDRATADLIIIGRLLTWVVMLLFSLAFYYTLRRNLSAIASLLGLVVLNSFPYLLERTVHLRHDTTALMILALALPFILSTNYRRLTVILCGLLCGLASAFHLLAIPITAGIAFWLLTFSDQPNRKRRISFLLMFLAAASVSFFAQYPLLFGTEAPTAFTWHWRMQALSTLYLDNIQSGQWTIWSNVFKDNPFGWILLAVAWCWAHWHIIFHQRAMPAAYKLYLVLTDFSLLIILLHNPSYEQHYLYTVIFGAMLLAAMFNSMVYRQDRERRVFIGTAVAIVILAGLATTGLHLTNLQKHVAYPERIELADSPAPLSGEAVRSCLIEYPDFFNPFHVRSNIHRRAQLAYLVQHSRPTDIVFTDWLNPPARYLPIPEHHGNVISSYYRSTSLPNDKKMIALVRRFDPTYQPDDSDQTTHFLRLFSSRTPHLILLEGTMAQLYCESTVFFQWINEHYEMRMEPTSRSVFAHLRAPLTTPANAVD